ncbi:MAG: hypothetical protein ACTHWF_08730, partial [Brachybacterium sp.]
MTSPVPGPSPRSAATPGTTPDAAPMPDAASTTDAVPTRAASTAGGSPAPARGSAPDPADGTAPTPAPRPIANIERDHPAVLVPGLKRLLKGSWEQRTWFSLAVLGATVFALLQIATSSIIGRVTENVVVPSFAGGEPQIGLIVGGGLAIFGIAVARAVTVMA